MAVASLNLKSRPMNTAYALDGPWTGLRAIPRHLRSPDHRKRLESGLEALGGLYEQMARRAALLASGMDRIDGLRAGMIDQLDAIDGDADFEPSICGDDREADAGDDPEPDDGLEPSLCGVVFGVGSDLDLEAEEVAL